MTGEPSHLELGVPDVDAARAFYQTLLGWESSTPSGPGSVQTPTLSIGLHPGDEARAFTVFFDVDDLDAALAGLAAMGGTMTLPPAGRRRVRPVGPVCRRPGRALRPARSLIDLSGCGSVCWLRTRSAGSVVSPAGEP